MISEWRNQVVQGDCLELMKKLPDNSVDLIVTDPPYNISQENNLSRKTLNSKLQKRNTDIVLNFGEWDIFDSEQDYFQFTENWFKECVRVLKPKGWILVWFDKFRTGYFDLLLAPKYDIKSRTILIWHKTNPTPSFRKVNYLSSSEFCWVGSKGSSKIKFFGSQNDMHNVFDYPNSSVYGVTKHPTEKPIEIIRKLILNNSLPNDLVLDPFLGSGTTAIACKQLGRDFIGMELSEEYCEIARKRLEQENLKSWF